MYPDDDDDDYDIRCSSLTVETRHNDEDAFENEKHPTHTHMESGGEEVEEREENSPLFYLVGFVHDEDCIELY